MSISLLCLIVMTCLFRSVSSFAVYAKRTSLITSRRRTTRCFSSIDIYNEQDDLPIDTKALEKTISKIRTILGYDTHSIQVILVDDKVMQERNRDTRGIDKPTDILSFPFLECTTTTGILEKPQFDIPDYYNLGDCIVDVPYVMRRCQEDYDYFEGGAETDGESESDSDSDLYDDDRGVSGAMAQVYDAEKRIHMLMVHGMLHLVGYDHIDDDDYELMVAREEEILEELGMLQEEKES